MGIAAYNRGSKAISDQITREMAGSNATVAVTHPAPETAKPVEIPVTGYYTLSQDPGGPPKIGERLYCTVTACRGWYVVSEAKIRGGSWQIKSDGFRGWGYAHNFTRKPPAWMVKA